MPVVRKPGEKTGDDGGIYQEIGPRGGRKENYAAVRDDEILPPTTEGGHKWKLVKRTPNSRR